jgi:squalene-associated FAD-dependent desaturase
VNVRSERKRIVVVGGGLAGLSASEALARSCGDRFDITLLESKRAAGGRAGSFIDPSGGETVDYCQHVAMGCCTNLIGLLDRCGLAGSMQRSSELQFLHPQHPPSRFAPSRYLPAPLHLFRTISAMRYLNAEQRLQVRRGLLRLFRSSGAALNEQTAGQWLRANMQDAETIRCFWDVIVVSALGEQTDVVAMSAVRKVFVDGFAAARGASDVLVPRLPLAELFGRRLRAAIEKLGVKVQTGMTVVNVQASTPHAATVVTADGTHLDADHVIVAVPWHAIAKLISGVDIPGIDQFARIPASPISGIHLWFDREITKRPHAVMVGTLAQWLFRDPIANRSNEPSAYYQVVISSSDEARSHPKEQLVETVLSELRHAFSAANEAKLIRSRIVTDPKSVFSIRPEVDAIRPSSQTHLPWLHLAGDWIATGWPSTMESAVISGRMAAHSVAEHESIGPIEIEPGLQRGWLARRIIKP